jgi:CRP-like cAMP-binding protein
MTAGETGDTLFLLTAGSLAVHIPTGEAETRVATLAAPALVGFMAVMMDAPRSATLNAEAACQVYEVAAADFAGLTADRPDLAERLAQISAEMAMENEASREQAARGAAAQADRLQQLKAMFARRLKDLLNNA